MSEVVVTGAEGFLGSHLMKKLPDAYGVSHKAYDLRQITHIEAMFRHTKKVEVLYHLAGVVGGIRSNQQQPGRFFYENMLMGLNIIHAATIHGVGKIIMVGTTCSYPKNGKLPFIEEDLFNGLPEETNAPYGIAKRGLYMMLKAYAQQYNIKFCYLIPTNLYGPGDASDHVIPMLIKKFLSREEIVSVWGTGKATRDFLYIDDCINALVKAQSVDTTEPINLGSNREISIGELALTIQKLCNHKGQIRFDASKPDGQPARLLDTRRAQKILNWQATTDLENGLAKTIRWVKENG